MRIYKKIKVCISKNNRHNYYKNKIVYQVILKYRSVEKILVDYQY